MKIRMLKNWSSTTFSSGYCMTNDVDNDLGRYLINIGFATEVREPKYVPYKEPKLEWIGKEINKNGKDWKDIGSLTEYKIYGIERINSTWYLMLVREIDVNLTRTVELDEAFEYFTWSDGTPFGEQAGGE